MSDTLFSWHSVWQLAFFILLASAKLLVPVPPDFPLFGGTEGFWQAFAAFDHSLVAADHEAACAAYAAAYRATDYRHTLLYDDDAVLTRFSSLPAALA